MVTRVIVLLLSVSSCVEALDLAQMEDDTKHQKLQHVDDLPQVAEVEGAGAERGPHWYSDNSRKSPSESLSGGGGTDSSLSLDSKSQSSGTSGASSRTTKEKRLTKHVYRECTPCALDMIRKHTNLGIRWICAEYQRAQRSFKSECMMRYRNCQDGTLFIKIGNHRCIDDSYHGKTWFYVYKV